MLKIVANISRSFLKIISNKVARSLTVTSGFEMLFAKIPLDIFRFTIYIYIIGRKLIKKNILKIKYDFRNDIIYTFHEIIVYISWNFINFKINQAYIYNFKIDEYKRKFDNSIFVWILSLFSSFVKKLWYVKKKIGKLDESNIKNFCKNFAKFNLLIFRLMILPRSQIKR